MCLVATALNNKALKFIFLPTTLCLAIPGHLSNQCEKVYDLTYTHPALFLKTPFSISTTL